MQSVGAGEPPHNRATALPGCVRIATIHATPLPARVMIVTVSLPVRSLPPLRYFSLLRPRRAAMMNSASLDPPARGSPTLITLPAPRQVRSDALACLFPRRPDD